MAIGSAKNQTFDIRSIVDWDSLDGWTQKQLLDVANYCIRHGWQLSHISEGQSRVLKPIVSVWKVSVNSAQEMKSLWVINGDLPIDTVPADHVTNAREAILAFSRKFIRRAQALKQDKENLATDEKTKMQRLVKAAADLLVLYHESNLWAEPAD